MHSLFLNRCRQTPAGIDLFLGSLILASLVAGGCSAPTSSHPAVGRLIGNLPLVSLADPTAGENPSAAASPTFLGKVTLLNFWGVWCMPCRRELPGLVRLADRLQSEPAFQFVAVSCGSGGPDDFTEIAATTRDFLAKQKISLAAWADPAGFVRILFSESFGFDSYPTTYLIGPDARVRAVWIGYRSRDEAEMAQAILKALKEVSWLDQPSTAQAPQVDP